MIRINDLYGKIHSVDAFHSDTVLTIKQAYSASPSSVTLFWKGIRLEDNKTLEDHGVPVGAALYVTLSQGYEPGYQLFIKTIKSTTCSFYVSPADTVASLKVLLSSKMDQIPPAEIRLFFTGQQLEDTKCLADYPITKESTLLSSLRLRGGAPTPWKGKALKEESEDLGLF
jgi:ubiquitin-like protein Nedd8